MAILQIPNDLVSTVQRALMEDVGSGDITSQLIPLSRVMQGQVRSRETAVLCGSPWFNEVFRQLDANVEIIWYCQESDTLIANQVLCALRGPARVLLTGERTALNFLQLLSGTATIVQRYVNAIRGTSAQILDTRKTLPGLRSAQKYAVLGGGGRNHRQGLYDAFLIKENHILAAGSISAAVITARRLYPHLPIEVEVETLSQIEEALQVTADSLLLDNFSVAQLKEAVALVQGRAKLEASGGITLENIRAIAETGVDFISVGTLTKHVQAIDLSMRFI